MLGAADLKYRRAANRLLVPRRRRLLSSRGKPLRHLNAVMTTPSRLTIATVPSQCSGIPAGALLWTRWCTDAPSCWMTCPNRTAHSSASAEIPRCAARYRACSDKPSRPRPAPAAERVLFPPVDHPSMTASVTPISLLMVQPSVPNPLVQPLRSVDAGTVGALSWPRGCKITPEVESTQVRMAPRGSGRACPALSRQRRGRVE